VPVVHQGAHRDQHDDHPARAGASRHRIALAAGGLTPEGKILDPTHLD
jgi:hypothetical protein